MKRQDTYDLARRFVEAIGKGQKGQMSLAFDGLPATSANEFLAGILERRVACHTADLTDEERHVVEMHLLDGRLDVVFATSTLAAGVNFPLGAAVFAGWSRWDGDLRARVPIETSDFHNMAGRVGRMGFAHDLGRVVFFASTKHELGVASKFLALGELPPIEPRVQPQRFNQLALQLVASGLCATQEEVERLVCSSFSALRRKTAIRWHSSAGPIFERLSCWFGGYGVCRCYVHWQAGGYADWQGRWSQRTASRDRSISTSILGQQGRRARPTFAQRYISR